jgi:hypothetical protein
MEKLNKVKEEKKTERDLKLSGKQIFLEKSQLASLILEPEDDENDEESKQDKEGRDDDEEYNDDDIDDEERVFYDKSLYALEEGITEEDVDFD